MPVTYPPDEEPCATRAVPVASERKVKKFPVAKVPAVGVNSLIIINLFPSVAVTPLLFNVRLFNTLVVPSDVWSKLIVPNVPAPAIDRLELLLPRRVPLPLTAPFKVKVFDPIPNLPEVKVKALVTVVLEPIFTPPEPLMVRLLILPVNTELGKFNAVVFVNAKVPELASIAPLVLVIAEPA